MYFMCMYFILSQTCILIRFSYDLNEFITLDDVSLSMLIFLILNVKNVKQIQDFVSIIFILSLSWPIKTYHDLSNTVSTEETSIQDFLEILKGL